MKTWIVIFIVFIMALATFGRIECVDNALNSPSQTVAAEFRATIFRPFYEAVNALDQTAGW